jgi:hypothetical protein
LRHADLMALFGENIGNADAPGGRHPASFLSPLQAGSIASAQIGGHPVDKQPRQIGGCEHLATMGQIVPRSKDKLTHEARGGVSYFLSMSTVLTPSEFDQLFIARTKALRLTKFQKSEEMAIALGIPPERYRKYESRTPMPHDLIERFAIITGVSVEFLITGRRVRGKGPYPDVPGPQDKAQLRAQQKEGS